MTTLTWLKSPVPRSRSEEQTLRCPRCEQEYLHQGAVSVFSRWEDAVSRRTVVSPCDGLITQSLTENNPSARRQGLEIEFSCEHCGDGLRLAITQHKGLTFVQWSWDREYHDEFGIN